MTTPIIDGHDIVSEIGEADLNRALVQPRRPMNGRLPLLCLYRREQGSSGLLRWDEMFIRPATVAGDLGVRKIKDFLATVERIQVPLLNSGDTLIIDNWRMLHGRSEIPVKCAGRVIERAYLENLK